MATILDSLRDTRGIRILDTQLDSSSDLAGRYDVLYHTNGNIYVAFARTNQSRPDANQVVDRQIWMARSTDGGTTFEAPVQISSRTGYWHNNPAICQINPADVNSPIGLVYTAASKWLDTVQNYTTDNYPYRTMVDTDLVRIAPIDILTNNTYNNDGIVLFRATNRFVVMCLNSTPDTIAVYENIIVDPNTADGFLDNAWTYRTLPSFGGAGTTNDLRAFKVRALRNGHLALIGSFTRATKGDIPLCDLGVSFSTDDGYTWSAIQYLTNYTGSPLLDVIGLDQCLDADIAELENNQLAIVFQEGRPPQTIGYYSDPQFNTSSGRAVAYHAAKNLLFMPNNNSVSGSTVSGIWVYDLTTQAFIFRFIPTGTPPIWSAEVNCVSISTDGKYLAAATSNTSTGGSVDVWDISATDPAYWTVVTSLRTSTTPAIAGTAVGWCEFTDDKTLLFSYLNGTGGTNNVWGGKIDVTNVAAGVTPLLAPSGSNIRYLGNISAIPHVNVASDEIHIGSGYYFWVTKISDGTCPRSYHFSGSNYPGDVSYDSINDEWVMTQSANVFRLEDDGTNITLLPDTITSTTDPMTPTSILGSLSFISGQFLYAPLGVMWYDYYSRKIQGPLFGQRENDLQGFNVTEYAIQGASLLRNNEWLCFATANGWVFQYLKATGRLRWGIFTYNAVSKLIDTSSDDFHLLCDSNWVPADDAEHLVKPRICGAPLGNVFLTAFRYFPQRAGARSLALVTGVMNLEHRQIGMRAAIAKRVVNPPTIQAKGRIAKRMTTTLGIKVQIHMAQCLKMQAWIIPEQTQTMQMKAAIVSHKSSHWGGAFNVTFAGKQRKLRLQFTANTGYTGSWTCTAQARIVQVTKTRFTGHFIIPANPDGTGTFTFSPVNVSYLQVHSMKAFVVSNR
jgi:hypothetical protein